MAGTIIVDRIESDASYTSTINVANRITFSNTVNFGAYSGTAPVAGFYLPTTNNLAFTTASTERMRIDSAGNVGIGVTPSYRLEVKGPSATAGQLSIHDGTGDTTVSGVTAASLLFQARDSSVRTIAEIDAVNTTTNGTGAALVFQTRVSDTLAERMRIDSSGNLLFNSGYGSVATAYGCRAWVNFNGTGVVAIRGSGNVTSITDTAVGRYAVNFTTALPDANYCTSVTATDGYIGTSSTTGITTSSANIVVTTDAGSYVDSGIICCSFFR